MEKISILKSIEKIKESNIFDSLIYLGENNGDGDILDIRRDLYTATIRVENIPSNRGYNGNENNPTKITYLAITNYKSLKTWLIYQPFSRRASIDNLERCNKERKEVVKIKKFLSDILDNFNQ